MTREFATVSLAAVVLAAGGAVSALATAGAPVAVRFALVVAPACASALGVLVAGRRDAERSAAELARVAESTWAFRCSVLAGAARAVATETDPARRVGPALAAARDLLGGDTALHLASGRDLAGRVPGHLQAAASAATSSGRPVDRSLPGGGRAVAVPVRDEARVVGAVVAHVAAQARDAVPVLEVVAAMVGPVSRDAERVEAADELDLAGALRRGTVDVRFRPVHDGPDLVGVVAQPTWRGCGPDELRVRAVADGVAEALDAHVATTARRVARRWELGALTRPGFALWLRVETDAATVPLEHTQVRLGLPPGAGHPVGDDTLSVMLARANSHAVAA